MMKTTNSILLLLITGFLFTTIHAQPSPIGEVYVCPPCGDGACDTQTYDKPGQCPGCNMTLIRKSNLKNVAIFIFDGVELLDFSGPGEVFAAADVPDGAFNVYTVAVSKDPLMSQGFL